MFKNSSINYEENRQESREETYPIAFPWEANPEHFPTPTRVWQDENYRFVENREEEINHAGSIEESVYVDAYEHSGKMHEDQKVHTETYEHVEKVQEETYNQDCKHIDGKEEIHDQSYDYVDNQEHDNVILNSNDAPVMHEKVQEAATNKHSQSNYTELQEENLKVTEQVEETIKVIEEDEKIIDVDCHQKIIEGKDNLMAEDKTTNTAAAFAIDEALSPSVQTRIGELIAGLHKDENDDDVSDRDLIPINFKPSSKLQSGIYTPSPLGSRTASRVGSRSGSRRSSIVSSRRNSLSGNQKRPLTDTVSSTSVLVETREQPSSLFASDKTSVFNRKTPYTSAAVTPAVVLTPEFETSSYFHNEEILTEQDDFLQPSAYCLSESLEMAHQTKRPAIETWNPLDALTKLKSQSESMVLKQSLTEALNRAVKEQEELDNLEQLESAVEAPRRKKSTALKSVWNNEEEEEELPSALLSGQSSPRTPVIRGMTSNLSNEIEQEKERYRQQRESLLLAQPQNAVASLLEAELDLSRGTLFKRRHYETQSEIPYEAQDTPFPLTHSKEEDEEEKSLHTAYYSEDVIKEAQKRLSMLTSSQKMDDISNNEPLPLPTDTFIPSNKPIMRPSHMYQQDESRPSFSSSFDSKKHYPNFGFDEQHKLKIYQPDLIEPEIIASMKSANVLQVKEGSLSKSTEKTLEENDEQKVSIEVEKQVTVNPCENESTEENKVVEYQEKSNIESVEKDDLEKKSTKEIGKQDCGLVGGESAEKFEGSKKEKAISEIVIETHEQAPTKEVVKVEIIDKQEETLTDKVTEKECLIPSDEDWITVAKEALITKESENDLAESSLKEKILTISEKDLVTIKKRELLKEEKEQIPIKDESFPFATKENTEQTCVIGELVVTGETQDVQSIIDSIDVHKKKEHAATKSKEALEEEAFEHHITAKATNLSTTKHTDVDILRIREKDEIQFKIIQPSETSKQLIEDIIINEDRAEEQTEEEKPQELIEIQKETAKEIKTDQYVEIYEVEEEEFDDVKIGHYEIEGLVVESDSQESVSESLIETVEAETVEHEYRTETLEFEEDEEILEVEEIDSGSHITTLELEDDDLEIESMDDEFQVEIMELEEEEGVSSNEIVQGSNMETIEIENEVLVTEISSREADTEIIEIETDVVEPEKRSQEINVETTMITMEPMEIEYGSPNAKATSSKINVETIETDALKIETINREVDMKTIETKTFPKRMSESVTSEIIGSSSFYTASGSLPSSTESLRRSATMPARKLSIAESLLSFSRPTITSIVTTPVIVEAFERNSDSSSLREDIVSRNQHQLHLDQHQTLDPLIQIRKTRLHLSFAVD
ncbi:hypothetical protein RO3G_02556 [Rhizopus delemar RA 99-880]|uniref:Uncharacterized protein n=1 Tax=Rhizopus delemar (strain RA 99-880 / ATCC MYA-4621 / FGSC 9543 / NRRL 43880) TaxID=246409 RepID=I1BNS2_RHIO9|nr:hypothetical protein RO3G_02556 [Rhizopus delemar RA 99-880]|eukprot:EIE77852.1 hypothetical protein RO3G_02556 [Rhizopus delemar RA 99-880]